MTAIILNEEFFDEWTSTIGPTAPRDFGSGYGQAYWEVRKKIFPTETVKAVDEALLNAEVIEFCRRFDATVILQLDQSKIASKKGISLGSAGEAGEVWQFWTGNR